MLLALADRVANYNNRNKNGGGGEKEQINYCYPSDYFCSIFYLSLVEFSGIKY